MAENSNHLQRMQTINKIANAGGLFVLNHSAGKDSQAMTAMVRKIVPNHQILVVHADLGRVEWPGNIEHIKKTTSGLQLQVCQNPNKTFLQMVKHRGMWPSPGQRQCTSDLKRGPIERTIRRYLKANPRFNGLIVNCMGIRADESPARKKQQPFRLNNRNSKAGREWYDWLPIFDWTEQDVFSAIENAGQKPHWAYAEGMSRLSCSFCIMANKSDLRTAARLRPELYREYVQLERNIDHTMSMNGLGLEKVTGIKALGRELDGVVHNAYPEVTA